MAREDVEPTNPLDGVALPIEISLDGEAAERFAHYWREECWTHKERIPAERAVLHAVSEAEEKREAYRSCRRTLRSAARHRDHLEGALEDAVNEIRLVRGVLHREDPNSRESRAADRLTELANELEKAVENPPEDLEVAG